MSPKSASQSIVDNVILTAFGRLSMAFIVPIICSLAFLAYTYAEGRLSDQAATQATATIAVSRHLDGVEVSLQVSQAEQRKLQERVVALETLQTRGAADRIRFQDQVLASLTDINRTLAALSSSNAANTATLEVLLKDRGHF